MRACLTAADLAPRPGAPLFLLLLPLAAAQDVSIHDELRSGSSATTVYGGSFTGAGWRVDDSNSRMFWDFGTQVDRGEVSVVIDDVSFENLQGDNNHLIELFDAGGHWSCSRAINFRVYGPAGGEDGRGDVKLKVWSPEGYAEERGGVQDWDGGAHTWTIRWDLAQTELLRDGALVVHLDTAGLDLRMGTLWLPINDWTGDYSAPIGALYSDLRLDAWEPVDDGGGGDDGPPDDGDPSTLTPMEDVGAASWAAGVYPDEVDLPADGAEELSYLQFDTSGLSGRVVSATLRLTGRDADSAEGDGGTVWAVSDTAWSEDSLTWATRPALGTSLGAFGAVGRGESVEIDVSAGVRLGARVAFAVTGTGNGVHFASKEDGAAAVLTVVTEPDAGDTGADGDSAGSGDDGGSGDSGGDAAGDPDEIGAPTDQMGCACASAAGLADDRGLVSVGALPAVLLGLGALVGRRRAR